MALRRHPRNAAANSSPLYPHQDQKSLLKWNELELWMEDNEYIRTGYRQASSSAWSSICSIFQLHNETVNIWSHLLSTVWFIRSVSCLHHSTRTETPKPSDNAVICLYYAGVIVCFALSTVFHVFSNHSKEIHQLGHELDHLGIVFVIWASAIASTNFALHGETWNARYMHYVFICGSAFTAAIFTLRGSFRQPRYRRVHFGTHVLFGCTAILPILQSLHNHGYEELDRRMSLNNFVGLVICNVFAGTIYVSRIPERWYPGQFDIWGSSHQWMHILAVFGALINLEGLLKAFQS